VAIGVESRASGWCRAVRHDSLGLKRERVKSLKDRSHQLMPNAAQLQQEASTRMSTKPLCGWFHLRLVSYIMV
jgi:hypothetical protein